MNKCNVRAGLSTIIAFTIAGSLLPVEKGRIQPRSSKVINRKGEDANGC
jgi:hypothetical protein